ncbi:MAG TPA: hypothetical protein VGJ14_12790 [Sporichthyaceae bacterium]|jgi:hypothetical protein
MTKTKRALTLAAVTAATTATSLVPATAAQARHQQPHFQITTVAGQARFTQLPTHDRVSIDVKGISDDGSGRFEIRSDAGRADGKVICVTGSRATPGFTDAAIGLHINRSTIAGLTRGTDAIEWVRDGGRRNADSSGLVTGSANCPTAGFTVPNGVLVQVPDRNPLNGGGDRTDHRDHRDHRDDGYRVRINH